MISAKMTDLVKNGSAIRAMFEEGKRMAELYGAENIYDFSLGNPSTSPPPAVKQAILEILENEPENLVHGYMSNSGYDDVRRKTAESINRKNGTSYAADNIIMTVGAAGALNVALKTLLNPGDEVIVQAPFFAEYINYIKNYDGVTVIVPPEYTTFGLNLEGIAEKITAKTKAMIVNSPNNPTGAVYSGSELEQLAGLLEEKGREYGAPIYLISDEPYREIVFDGAHVPYIPKIYKNTIVAYSYSKSLSLPGERIGYLVVPDVLDGYGEIYGAMNVANRILGYVNAPSLFQRVSAYCLDTGSDISVYEENKKVLYSALREAGYECTEPKGAFYLFPKCLIDDDKAFCTAAKEFRLLIVPGTTFACPGYFRLAFCVSRETAVNSLESFRRLAERYKK